MSVREPFLHFIWKHQLFRKAGLVTTTGQPVHILSPGRFNTNSGPDFLNARILIGDIEWAGHVEIHVQSSDWDLHGHTTDAAYEGVVLHVVWQSDKVIKRTDGQPIPEMSLGERVGTDLLARHEMLLSSISNVPCKAFLSKVHQVKRSSMLDRALAERLMQRAMVALKEVQEAGNDWNEAFFRVLCASFGFKVNKEAFRSLGQSVPLSIIRRNASSQMTIEAILFGQAGMLQGAPVDNYCQGLKSEYTFQLKKHVFPVPVPLVEWKFMRMRPANFPTLRIAQLATIVREKPDLFSFIRDEEDVDAIIGAFQSRQSEYWQCHYRFGKKADSPVPGLGKDGVHLLLINAAIPFLGAWAVQTGESRYMDKAMHILEKLPAEKNAILRMWKDNGMRADNAHSSQALIQLYNNWCVEKRCMECGIGYEILNGRA